MVANAVETLERGSRRRTYSQLIWVQLSQLIRARLITRAFAIQIGNTIVEIGPNPAADTDGDGVHDVDDLCPESNLDQDVIVSLVSFRSPIFF